jgi:hypothetical protein
MTIPKIDFLTETRVSKSEIIVFDGNFNWPHPNDTNLYNTVPPQKLTGEFSLPKGSNCSVKVASAGTLGHQSQLGGKVGR